MADEGSGMGSLPLDDLRGELAYRLQLGGVDLFIGRWCRLEERQNLVFAFGQLVTYDQSCLKSLRLEGVADPQL